MQTAQSGTEQTVVIVTVGVEFQLVLYYSVRTLEKKIQSVSALPQIKFTYGT